ncbi:MAG: hypothetical protein DRI34_00940 [Deltaproteobacteria bacterium]|nr:MAG: hypothetical protein DRI34_00940 [Deltaproteobacteria bacterium]
MDQAVVLLIDSDSRRRQELSRVVEALPGEVLLAADGQEGLRVLQSRPVDLVICCRQLASPSAAEIFAYIADFFPDPPATLLLVDDEQQPRQAAASARADAALAWPAQRGAASQLLELLLRQAELQTRLKTLEEENLELHRAAARLTRGGGEDFPRFDMFKRVVVMELRKARRYGYPLSVLLVAIDRFEEVARWLDEAQRKSLFRSVWQALHRDLRDTDLTLLFAEEKLLVLMPHTNLEGAVVVADRVRQRVAAIPPPASLVELKVTVSLSAASTENTRQARLGALVALAMKGIEEAAFKGGDLVIVCTERPPDDKPRPAPLDIGKLGDRTFFL